MILFVCPPKFCISIVSSFYWDLQWSQEKTKTILMQNLGDKQRVLWYFPKWPIVWRISNCSFVFMLIILTSLVSTNKIQKNFYLKVRLVRVQRKISWPPFMITVYSITVLIKYHGYPLPVRMSAQGTYRFYSV